VALGLAGAGVIVMAVSGLTVMFSEAERPRAVGIWAAANFLALPIGPILGGWLLTHYWWGWVFLINVPVAAVGLLAVVTLVPESRAPERPGLDPLGVATSSAGLALVTYGLIDAGNKGWGSAWTLGPLLLGLAVLVTFSLWSGGSPGDRMVGRSCRRTCSARRPSPGAWSS
jgi:MFS family permease